MKQKQLYKIGSTKDTGRVAVRNPEPLSGKRKRKEGNTANVQLIKYSHLFKWHSTKYTRMWQKQNSTVLLFPAVPPRELKAVYMVPLA